jgi:hypothetical protein
MAVDTITRDETDTADANPTTDDGFALAHPYNVPGTSAFSGKDFIIDPPELVAMVRDMIFECSPEFDHLQAASIEVAWKRKGGMANGGVQVSGHKRSDAHAVAHGAKEFILWVAADIPGPVTREQVERAVYHELCHLGYNENTGEVKIVDEPVKYFPSERRRYGIVAAEPDGAEGQSDVVDGHAEDVTDNAEPGDDGDEAAF